MRLTITARLGIDDQGNAIVNVTSFAGTLDKRESAALLKACGKPVDFLLTQPELHKDERAGARHSPSTLVLTGPDGQDSTDRTHSTGPVHGPNEDQEPTTPLDLILETLRAHGGVMNHDDFRDAVFVLAKQRGADDETVVTLWSPQFWKSRPELAVTQSFIAIKVPGGL
jgi:hypothetical protein